VSIYNALDSACEQAQQYADALHKERMIRIALQARYELLEKRLRDVEILLNSKMPMTALDYLQVHREEPPPARTAH
jgi:hypothetical protein